MEAARGGEIRGMAGLGRRRTGGGGRGEKKKNEMGASGQEEEEDKEGAGGPAYDALGACGESSYCRFKRCTGPPTRLHKFYSFFLFFRIFLITIDGISTMAKLITNDSTKN
jgi:hypothetical protein